jgi:ABC-type transport system involved in cytochrome bd biosynthesis fused ATPase/permease subunit
MLDPFMYFWNLLGRNKRAFILMMLTSICTGLLRFINSTYSIAVIGLVHHYRMRLTTIFWFILIVQTLLALLQIYIYIGQLWVLREELSIIRYLIRKHWNTVLRRLFHCASYEWLMENSSKSSIVQHMTIVHADLNRLLQIIPRCIVGVLYSIIIFFVTVRISLLLSAAYLLIQVSASIYMYYVNQHKLEKIMLLKTLTAKFSKCTNNIFGTLFDTVLNRSKGTMNEETATRYLDRNCKSLNRELSRKIMFERRVGSELITLFYIFHCLLIVFFLFTSLDNFEKFMAIFLWIRSIFTSLEYLLTEVSSAAVEMHMVNIDFANLEDMYRATSQPRTLYRQFTPFSKYQIEMNSFNYMYKDNSKFGLALEKPLVFNYDDIVLIDGDTGSGKSTLLKIMRSIHNVPELRLRYRDDDEKHNGSWRLLDNGWANLTDTICFCQQSANVFVDNGLYYIVSGTFPGERYNRELVERALRIADIPEQLWDRKSITQSSVSGGECQRIAIARVIHRILQQDDRNIIILDEIDANLDEHTAKRIFNRIFELCPGKLIFIVAHTPSIKQLKNITKVINVKNGYISA